MRLVYWSKYQQHAQVNDSKDVWLDSKDSRSALHFELKCKKIQVQSQSKFFDLIWTQLLKLFHTSHGILTHEKLHHIHILSQLTLKITGSSKVILEFNF